MVEVHRAGCPARVSGNVATTGIDFAAIPNAGGTEFCDLAAGGVVNIIYRRGGSDFAHPFALGVVNVLRRGTTIYPDNPALTVISVGMRAIARDVARSVISDAGAGWDSIVCVERQGFRMRTI